MILNYLLLFGALAIGRAFDLASTYFVSPDLRLEMNQWMKKMGWGKVILLNLIITVVAPLVLSKSICMFLVFFSVFIGIRNFQLSTAIRFLGSDRYQKYLYGYYQETKWSSLLVPILLNAFSFMVVGTLIAGPPSLREHKLLWIISAAGFSMMFAGIFIAVAQIITIHRCKKFSQII